MCHWFKSGRRHLNKNLILNRVRFFVFRVQFSMKTKVCSCGKAIPFKATINGVERQLKNRRRCFECSPFQGRNNWNLTEVLSRSRTVGNEKYRRWQEKARRERKALLVAQCGGECRVCGYNRCVAALEFHHRDPTTKKFNLGKDNLLKAWDVVLSEAEKCDLLCANCHRELEDNLLKGNFLGKANC